MFDLGVKFVGPDMGVKASVVSLYEDALVFIEAGATRTGLLLCSHHGR